MHAVGASAIETTTTALRDILSRIAKTARSYPLDVAMAATVVLYDRLSKLNA